MTQEQLDREMNYRAAICLAREMLKLGYIDERDFAQFDQMLRQKFDPVSKCLLA